MAANFSIFHNFSTLSVFCFFHLLVASLIESSSGGFSVDLIHRDSPLSPFYTPSDSQLDRVNNAFHRSISRSSQFKSTKKSSGTIQSQIRSVPGEYLMKVSIGTPPVEMLGIADTGSDLTWTQCNPCADCFEQKAPFFNPQRSSTYKNIACTSQPCEALSSSTCSSNNACEYDLSYGDQSYSNGDLAVETFTFGSTSGQTVPIEKVVFGCGHDNDGNFNENTSGIIGLGGGQLSIVNQFNGSIGGKFSYCLVPIYKGSNVTSKINFGSSAVVSGSGVVSTPLFTKSPRTFYYLTLDSITVGNKSLEFRHKESAAVGNIIIDSGTTLTLLPRAFYQILESALKEAIGAEPSPDPEQLFSLCYRNITDLNVPTLTVHFTDADLDLPPSTTFIEVEENLVCFTMIPSDDLAIFGNLSQMNFLIGYDLVNKKVSFMPTDCTKQ